MQKTKAWIVSGSAALIIISPTMAVGGVPTLPASGAGAAAGDPCKLQLAPTVSYDAIDDAVGSGVANAPRICGGGQITHFEISPPLPQGLSINSVTGVISGTVPLDSAWNVRVEQDPAGVLAIQRAKVRGEHAAPAQRCLPQNDPRVECQHPERYPDASAPSELPAFGDQPVYVTVLPADPRTVTVTYFDPVERRNRTVTTEVRLRLHDDAPLVTVRGYVREW